MCQEHIITNCLGLVVNAIKAGFSSHNHKVIKETLVLVEYILDIESADLCLFNEDDTIITLAEYLSLTFVY